MTGRKIKLIDGDEYDVMYAKNWYCYLKRAGASSRIKRRIRRRERHQQKKLDTY